MAPRKEAASELRETSAGPCPLPIVYRDGAMLGLVYRLAPEIFTPMLQGTGLEVWPLMGRAVALLCAWSYRESSVGTYGEVGLGVYVRRQGTNPSWLHHGLTLRGPDDIGIWVLNLPVSTEAAYAAGVEVWGYPKYVTPIDARFDAAGVQVTLGTELSVQMGPSSGLRVHGFPIVTLTRKNGQLIRTVIEVQHHIRFGGASSVRVSLPGDGPSARTARAMGLETARAFAAFRTDDFRAVLPEGRPLPAR